jgi:hypothetical protein
VQVLRVLRQHEVTNAGSSRLLLLVVGLRGLVKAGGSSSKFILDFCRFYCASLDLPLGQAVY